MFIVSDYRMAVLFCIITMICWGSWPGTQKLANRSWRFELFYWDYVLGILLVSILVAVTAGSIGESGRGFRADIGHANIGSGVSAMVGGIIFNAGNILFVAAITVAGMSVAFPIGGGLALVLGVVINYFAAPVGNPWYLFAGAALIMLAMVFSAFSYKSVSRGEKKISAKGILLSILAGTLFGFFYRFIANATATDFFHPEKNRLTPYTAIFFFALGIFISNILFNTLLMKRPFGGVPVNYADYFKGSARDHLLGVAGGGIWGIGLVLSILAASQAGFAISFGLGQGNAMMAAVWGIFVWKEFRGAPASTSKLLLGMFIFYISGLLLIIFSRML